MASDPRYPGARSQEKNGRLYWRVRINGKDQTLPGQPGDAAFELRYNKLIAGEAQVVPLHSVRGLGGRKHPLKGYWHAWTLLQETPDWSEFESETRRAYERYIYEFCESPVKKDSEMTWADVVIGEDKDEAPLLRKFFDEMHKAFGTKAVCMRRAVQKLVKVAVAENWIDAQQDPTLTVKLKRRKNTPQKAWPVEVRQQFEAKWKHGTVARIAYSLALYLGNRRGDVANLRWSDIKLREIRQPDGTLEWVEVFEFTQLKNRKRSGGGTVMMLSIPKPLVEALAAAPRNGDYILPGHNGRRRYASTLTGQMADWTEKAGLEKGYTLHGLRRTYATLLSDNGASTVAVQHAMGHKNLATTAIYLNEASRVHSMVNAGAIFDDIAAREARMPKRSAATQLRLVK